MTTQSDYQQKTPQRKRLSTDNTSKKTTLKKHIKENNSQETHQKKQLSKNTPKDYTFLRDLGTRCFTTRKSIVGNETTVEFFFNRSWSDNSCDCSCDGRAFAVIITFFFSFALFRGGRTGACFAAGI